MPSVTVVRTYLELRSPDALRPAVTEDPALQLSRAPLGDVTLFRRLYRDVGGRYHWRDRDALADEEIRRHFESSDVELWVLHHGTEPAGFFELRRHEDGSVEIVYFGLVAGFFGHGLGKHLLTRAAQAAWEMGANRVWLHTCTLDSPAALPNYLARGFDPVRTETYETTVPDDPPPAA
jgi:GNAT superfamily N-acetyltransferase